MYERFNTIYNSKFTNSRVTNKKYFDEYFDILTNLVIWLKACWDLIEDILRTKERSHYMNSIKALMWYYDISYATAESYLNDIDEELLQQITFAYNHGGKATMWTYM